jgi:hypothetical protein
MSQSEKLPPVSVDDDGILYCPVCGDPYLHQHEVEIGWRPEDGDAIRHTSNRHGVETDSVPADEVQYGCRRQYLVMRLWCEFCGDGFELELRQHKGATVLSWVKVGDAKAENKQPETAMGWY